jgi:hypothetical protein
MDAGGVLGARSKAKVKSNGQECPFHTGFVAFAACGASRQQQVPLRAWRPVRNDKSFYGSAEAPLVQEILAVEGVALGGAEAGVANDSAELFFCGAVGHACGSYYIFF